MSSERTKRGLRDLVLSLAVVGLFVAFLFVVVWRPSPDPVRTVDPAPVLLSAREQAGYPVYAPTGLTGNWRATSARFEADGDATVWFLGYVTPDDQYIAVAQTDGDAQNFIEEQTLDGSPDGEMTVDGQVWQRYTTTDQRSLVRSSDGSTVVVTGSVSYEQLADFAGRLSA
ncbi:MAG: DUF4245 domain-containing protein [Actinobacteria bacterium]|nr:DUF4245 domain-containing protein [Actinomycetota bacterium]MCB8997359.1 DUF4245 domain-containing protein [Actinomycetota bacterium]MCB9414147.1 DUF4245 domain-containing protein [Actinomycetota bacterium]MCB9423666.1 DUF4245 domain-containing protein [Actinomycetota bacterium]HRY10727.1 DUF4245 domain-containing protein [Candidatus Nanopelagicales bacterium]